MTNRPANGSLWAHHYGSERIARAYRSIERLNLKGKK